MCGFQYLRCERSERYPSSYPFREVAVVTPTDFYILKITNTLRSNIDSFVAVYNIYCISKTVHLIIESSLHICVYNHNKQLNLLHLLYSHSIYLYTSLKPFQHLYSLPPSIKLRVHPIPLRKHCGNAPTRSAPSSF